MRSRLGKEKRFKTMMAKHEKDDLLKYKKLQFNVAGLRDYAFDSYGNPITVRNDKPQPVDLEVVKTEFKISKKIGPHVINPYYAQAYKQVQQAKVKAASFLPMVGPKAPLQEIQIPPLENKQGSKSALEVSSKLKVTLKKKKETTLIEEHMTESQRVRSNSELPDLVPM